MTIIKASQGRNKDGDSNCGFVISEQILSAENQVKVLRDFILTTPELYVIVNNEYVIVDFKFPKTSLVDVNRLWTALERFGKMQNEYLDKEDAPVFHITAAPIEFAGKYFYTLVNPCFWAKYQSVSSAPVDTIRLLFKKAAINFFEADQISEESVNAEIEQEFYEEQRLAEIEAQKEIEHEEYLNKLNERFNNMQ